MSALLESLLDPERRSQAVSADEKAAVLENGGDGRVYAAVSERSSPDWHAGFKAGLASNPLAVELPKQEVTEHELMRLRIAGLREEFLAIAQHYDGDVWNVIDFLQDAETTWKSTYPLTTEQITERYYDARCDDRRDE